MNKDCPIAVLINVLGKKWTLLIMHNINNNNNIITFNDLIYEINGLSSKILAQRLKELEKFGLINRIVKKESKRIVYELTDKGKELSKMFVHIENSVMRFS